MTEPHPNLKLLSHSSDQALDCNRKFEIYKLRPTFGSLEIQSGDEDLDFGSIVGIGVQSWLQHKDIDKAYWDMFQSWSRHLDDEDGIKKKKTFWHSMLAIDKFKIFFELELQSYELVSFSGTPAIELGFSIDCGDGFYYRGFLDALLYDNVSQALVPLENKTTGNYNLHEAMYKNSGQGSGYKLIVDAISKMVDIPLRNKYKIIYPVYQCRDEGWQKFEFNKTSSHLARWIRNLLVNKERIQYNAKNNYWPTNGSQCFAYNRPCKYFDLCDMPDEILFGRNGEKIEPKDIDKDLGKYKFHFHLNDLISMVMEG